MLVRMKLVMSDTVVWVHDVRQGHHACAVYRAEPQLASGVSLSGHSPITKLHVCLLLQTVPILEAPYMEICIL